VTTPQTVQSFIGGAPRVTMAARLTLVTLDCRAFGIATSVGRVEAAVYSPRVLRLRANRWRVLRFGEVLYTGRRRGTRASEANAARAPPVRSSPEWTTT